jgi:hypothetical protein
MAYQIQELGHHQKHEMVDAAANLREASLLHPSALLKQQYATEVLL